MINIHQLLVGLTQVIGKVDFPDAASLATALDLDISQASVTETKLRTMCINTARLNSSATEVGIACGVTPRREIWLIFVNPSIHYRDLKDEVFGANQRIQPSKLRKGLGVLFELDGWTCGLTASSPDGVLQSLFCEELKPASAG